MNRVEMMAGGEPQSVDDIHPDDRVEKREHGGSWVWHYLYPLIRFFIPD